MGNPNQPTVVTFQKNPVDQSLNFGTFLCPLCDQIVSVDGAYWPGTLSIPTVVRLHFSSCVGERKTDILHFVVREQNGRMPPKWFALDLGVPLEQMAKTPEEALRTATWKEIYHWVGNVVAAASGLNVRFIAATEEQYPDVPELGGYPIYFRFTNDLELMVLDVPGDTERTIAAKLLRKLHDASLRPAA